MRRVRTILGWCAMESLRTTLIALTKMLWKEKLMLLERMVLRLRMRNRGATILTAMIQKQATSCRAKRFGLYTICTTIFINLLTLIGVNQVNLVGQVAKIGAMDSLPEETEVAEIMFFTYSV